MRSQRGYTSALDKITGAGRVNIIFNQSLSALKQEFGILAQKRESDVTSEHLDAATYILSLGLNGSFYENVLKLLCDE